MATMASALRAARKASLASRAAAAAASRARAASRAAAKASSAALAAAAAAGAAPLLCSGVKPRRPSRFAYASDYAHLPDDAKTPTDNDFESDEALRALYERWCKAFMKERDNRGDDEMDRRFKLFRYAAEFVHTQNTSVPHDPEEAAIYRDKRREAKILLSKGEDVSHFDECYLPVELGLFADGGDPYLDENDMDRLKAIEEKEASLGKKSQTLN